MSDIAAAVGINRPTLHYYFRTKDRMFQAVFGSIVGTLLPRIQEVISNSEASIEARVGMIIDIYYSIFKAHPMLPLFVIKEMHRDFGFLERNIMAMGFDKYFIEIKQSLQDEMDAGRIRAAPFRYLFLTFYSLLIMPFTVRPLCQNILLNAGESFDDMLAGWKKVVEQNMKAMLMVEGEGVKGELEKELRGVKGIS